LLCQLFLQPKHVAFSNRQARCRWANRNVASFFLLITSIVSALVLFLDPRAVGGYAPSAFC
jgi:hypothetical protein